MIQEKTLNYLGHYCERAGEAGLWGEPINVLTNMAFLLAAILALRALFRSAGDKPLTRYWDVLLLIGCMAAVSVGSGLWHLLAVQWALMADVIPIALFIHIYLLSFFIRILNLRWFVAAGCWGLFQGVSFAFEHFTPPDLLNGTILYVPSYLMLMLLVGVIWKRGDAIAKPMMRVVIVWSVSLLFRTMDMEVCHLFPLGTHFLWHVLNAWVLYQLVTLLMAHAVNNKR